MDISNSSNMAKNKVALADCAMVNLYTTNYIHKKKLD